MVCVSIVLLGDIASAERLLGWDDYNVKELSFWASWTLAMGLSLCGNLQAMPRGIVTRATSSQRGRRMGRRS